MATKKSSRRGLSKKEAHTLVRLARKAASHTSRTARDPEADRRRKRSRDAYDKKRRHGSRRR